MDGFEVSSRLTSWNGRSPAVVLTSSRDASEFSGLVERSGARGFVAKAELWAPRSPRFFGESDGQPLADRRGRAAQPPAATSIRAAIPFRGIGEATHTSRRGPTHREDTG